MPIVLENIVYKERSGASPRERQRASRVARMADRWIPKLVLAPSLVSASSSSMASC